MDATFTPEQRLLQDTAVRMAEKLGASTVEGLATRDVTMGVRLLADSGLIGLRFPTDAGGSAASALEVAIVAEALARFASPVPFLGRVLAGELLVAGGASLDVLAALADGSRGIAIALASDLTGPGGGGDARSVAWDAAGATEAAVLVPSKSGERHVGVVPLNGGVIDSIDLTRMMVEIEGAAGAEFEATLDEDALTRWTAFALTIISADMVGAMTGALEMAVAYAKQRVQFGRPIGSFQAIQHLCAEQYVSIEAARSAMYYAAWAVDGLVDASDALVAARTAKAYASREAPRVAEANLQVHGGIGQSWESLAHVFLRRVLLDAATLGDETFQLRAITAVLDEAPSTP